jgi:uncharacterized caspase-like protein/formylglycine-generating enzyme required for sulfatase activity
MDWARIILISMTALISTASWGAETRVALVIGNSEYASGPLPNPANDAKLMGDALTSLGFDVIARRNADQTTMKRAIEEFGSRLEKAGAGAVGLFYYAGHGVQLNGKNYLIPTTARIDREGDVEIEAVSADWVIEQMRYARNQLNIVILDACRNNPFTRSMRSVDHGLASMDAPAGIIIAYSTAPGSVAADGSGRDSPYTEALTQAIRDLHEPVEQVFKHVRVNVMAETGGKQIPWEASSLTGDFYFAGPSKVAPETSQALAKGAVPVPAAGKADADRGGSVGSWFSGLFGADSKPENQSPPPPAGTRLAAVPNRPPAAPPARADGILSGARSIILLKSLGIPTDKLDSGHNYQEAAIRQLVDSTPRRITLGSAREQIRAAYTLCQRYSADCQESWYADEELREVTLDPFQMDRTPVSVRAFRQFVESSRYKTQAETTGVAYAVIGGSLQAVPGGSWRNGIKKRAPGEDTAVIGVSFQDALAYCHSRGERLPSEDEWEYVARGPGRQTFPWGENVEPAAAPLSAPPRVSDGPAEGIGGQYRGMAGNVWQWVDTKVGSRKVLKGGSWLEPNPANKRGATRRYEVPSRADEDSGFRCARSVPAWPDTELWVAQLQQ